MADAALLAQLSGLSFAFVLVLARCAGAVAVLPGFAETGVPAMVRAGIAGALALLLTPLVAPMIPPVPGDVVRLAAAITAELLSGLWLGFLARLLALALPIAGQIAAGLLGLSNVLQPNPELGAQTTALSQLFSLAAAVLVFATGLYALPLAALAGSYRLIGPGALLPSGGGAEAVAKAVGQSFAIAVRLAAPALVMSVLWSLGSGVASRIAPRVQVYFIAMPAQILLGLALLGATSAALLASWQEALRAGWGALPGLH